MPGKSFNSDSGDDSPKQNPLALTGLLAIALLAVVCRDLVADWPSYRGDNQRTAFREQSLNAVAWKPAWVREFAPPSAAWSKPARGSIWQNLTSIEARVTDDRANVPLICSDSAGKLHVLVPSSTEDRLVSLDPGTGNLNWQVDTQGPIRYAPSIDQGIAFLGSDDGFVRSIDLRNGRVVWQVRIGPEYPSIIGNGRVISSHPVRTSVIVQNDKVIAHAGLFPSQGVYAVALDRTSGKLIWRKRIQTSSQGYLLDDSSDRIYVPTGRSVPYAIDSSNGKKLFDLPSPGGTFCILTPDLFFTGPGNTPETQSFATGNKAKMLSYKARQIAVGMGKIWTANGSRIVCHSLTNVLQGKQETVWEIESKLQNGLAVSGTSKRLLLFVGGKEKIEIYNALTGKPMQEIQIGSQYGEIVHLAISDSKQKTSETIVATTATGHVLCWTSDSTQQSFPKSEENFDLSRKQPKTDAANETRDEKLTQATRLLPSQFGFALVAGRDISQSINQILDTTSLHVVGCVPSSEIASALRNEFRNKRQYGIRVSIVHHKANPSGQFADGLFNLVVNRPGSEISDASLSKLCCPGYGVSFRSDGTSFTVHPLKNAGVWRHQYANPNNLADSRDEHVGNAVAFRLKWFGGVGPSRMPDRHLRGPAPLCAGPSMIVQADGLLIGVDPANGTERWQFKLPEKSMRYVTPYDGGYACLTKNGREVTFSANREIITLNALTGSRIKSTNIRQDSKRWGYLARNEKTILTSIMKSSAPRIATDRKTQRTFVDSDYRSNRPLVCSRSISSFDDNFNLRWNRKSKGVIPNGSISIDFDQSIVLFIEGRSATCLQHPTDRITTQEILEEGYLVCLDLTNGKTRWESPVKWKDASNVLYTQIADSNAILTSSVSKAGKARYLFRCYSLNEGNQQWDIGHDHVKAGLYHGEQVHHPLILQRPDGQSLLVAEPFFYDLDTGKPISIFADEPDWAIRRPGHSCGTLSGSGNCLFFRANNPTVLNLNQSKGERFTALAPSRPGCWINIIPANGHLLIPEASASCVCKYSLQTSICFEPVAQLDYESKIVILPDVVPESN